MSGKIHWCQVLKLFYNHLLMYFAGIIHDKECKSAPGLLPVCRYDALLRWWQTDVVIQYVYTIHFHLLNFYLMLYMIGHFWFFPLHTFLFVLSETKYFIQLIRIGVLLWICMLYQPGLFKGKQFQVCQISINRVDVRNLYEQFRLAWVRFWTSGKSCCVNSLPEYNMMTWQDVDKSNYIYSKYWT